MARRRRVYRQIEGKKRYEHRAKTVVSVSILIIILAFPISVFRARTQTAIDERATMDMAQVARNMARGSGFTTNIIRPGLYSSLPRFTKPPDIVNPPLQIWLLASLPGMKRGTILASPDGTVASLSTFFYLAAAVILYLLERRILGNRQIAVATIIYLFNVPLLRAAVSGSGATLGAALVTLLFGMVYADRNKSFLYSFLIGAVVGLCYLASYVFLAMLIPVVACKTLRGGENLPRHLVATVVGLLLATAPWMARNAHLGGNLLLAQPFSAVFLGSVEAAKATGFWGKVSLQYAGLYGTMLNEYGGVFALPFFLISPLVRGGGEDFRQAKLFLLGGGALVFLLSMLGEGGGQALAAFVPGAILVGCKTFIDLIGGRAPEQSVARSRILSAFVALNLVPFAAAITAAPAAAVDARGRDSRLRSMVDMHSQMHVGEIVMTNAQEWMAYYGEFNTLPLPGDRAELKKWEGEFGQLRFAAVCPYGTSGPVESMILRPRVVPPWLISEKAYLSPSGEKFFVSADAEDITAVSR